MKEKTLEKKLREKVKAKGGLAIKIFSPWFTGLPDRIVLMPGGRLRLAEIKSFGKKPSARQEVVFPMLEKLGFPVSVIDTDEKLQNFLKEL